MPVRLSKEKLPRGKVRMLYCDAAGKLYSSLMDRAVYKLARDSAQTMEKYNKCFAMVGLESSPGEYIPRAVEIGYEEELALKSILEHSLKYGRLPDVLKKYLKPILKLGEEVKKGITPENSPRKRQVTPRTTPKVLNRLPYYSEQDMEVSVPIYKAEQSYPLIMLEHLSENEKTVDDSQRLLVLDNDGDVVTVEVPAMQIDRADKALEKWKLSNPDSNMCMIISKRSRGLSINHMEITQLQRRALDTITRHIEQSDHEKQHISTVAKKKASKARDEVLS